MGIALDEFLKNLRVSQLMSAEEISAVLERHPQIRQSNDGDALAQVLLDEGLLTSFQASSILKGKPKGLVLGEYILLERIGAGGMGQVFKAIHQRMERIVALKVLPMRMKNSPEAVQRFHREVKAGAKLSHANIVSVYDAGEMFGIYFLAMEFVDGIDLSKLIAKEGGLPVRQALDFILQAAAGLDHAHSLGVIHRDIKPANLLLDKNGTIKLLDLGLAQLQGTLDAERPDGAEQPPEKKNKTGLTQAGTILGTIHYMAPEQARDPRHADQLSDIYSLGCTLHYLLTVQSVYPGDTLDEQAASQARLPVPKLRAVRPDVTPAVEAVFQKMVAKKPEERFQSMNEVFEALKACLSDAPAAAPEKKDESIPEFVIKAIFDD